MTEKKNASDFLYEVIKTLPKDETLSNETKQTLERYLRSFDLEAEKNTAKGIVVVALNPNGAVVAQGVDFDKFSPGGMRPEESQRMRALHSMKMDFAKQHLNHFMVEKIDSHFASDYWEHASNNGYKAEVVKVGYPLDEE